MPKQQTIDPAPAATMPHKWSHPDIARYTRTLALNTAESERLVAEIGIVTAELNEKRDIQRAKFRAGDYSSARRDFTTVTDLTNRLADLRGSLSQTINNGARLISAKFQAEEAERQMNQRIARSAA